MQSTSPFTTLVHLNIHHTLPQDRYILGSMVFLFLVAGHHGFITRISDDDLSATIDLYVFIGFVCLYILLHVIFFIVMIIRVCLHICVLCVYIIHFNHNHTDNKIRILIEGLR